jgi:hypothetical protein
MAAKNKKITLQDVFNTGWVKFVVEKNRPGHDGRKNAYRYIGNDKVERRCIFGWTLDQAFLDKLTTEDLESGAADLVDKYPEVFNLRSVTSYFVVNGVSETRQVTPQVAFQDAQSTLHDDLVSTKGTWLKKYNLREVYEEFAKKYKLTIPSEAVIAAKQESSVKPSKPKPAAKSKKASSKKLTLQSIFNAAWNWFVVKGGQPACDNGGSCVYLDPVTKNRCVIGAALTLPQLRAIEKLKDEEGVGPAADKNPTASTLVAKFPEWFDTGNMSSDKFAETLDCMQYELHDGVTKVNYGDTATRYWRPGVDLRAEYVAFAESNNLTIPTQKIRKQK